MVKVNPERFPKLINLIFYDVMRMVANAMQIPIKEINLKTWESMSLLKLQNLLNNKVCLVDSAIYSASHDFIYIKLARLLYLIVLLVAWVWVYIVFLE